MSCHKAQATWGGKKKKAGEKGKKYYQGSAHSRSCDQHGK